MPVRNLDSFIRDVSPIRIRPPRLRLTGAVVPFNKQFLIRTLVAEGMPVSNRRFFLRTVSPIRKVAREGGLVRNHLFFLRAVSSTGK